MMSWYNMVAARRSKSLMTGNVRCGVAAVHEVLGSLALEIPVNCHFELMEGTGGGASWQGGGKGSEGTGIKEGEGGDGAASRQGSGKGRGGRKGRNGELTITPEP